MLFMNGNIKCGYSFSKLERKEQCGPKLFVFSKIFDFAFSPPPCELENAYMYCIK